MTSEAWEIDMHRWEDDGGPAQPEPEPLAGTVPERWEYPEVLAEIIEFRERMLTGRIPA